MSMETDFRALMADDAGVAGRVETRIFPSTFAQATASPAIRYQKVTSTIGVHMTGSDGLEEATMQVDIRGTTVISVLLVRDALRDLLHTFRGVKGDTDFRLIMLDSDRGITFDKTGPEEFFLGSLDFTVFSRAAA